MIHVEHHTIRAIKPNAPSYEVWEFRSQDYRFSRLRSAHQGVGQLITPDAPADYLLSLNLGWRVSSSMRTNCHGFLSTALAKKRDDALLITAAEGD